jgi:hypothetical protein
MFTTSCEGPQGVAGANGSDGTDGVDGNAVCMECHNLTVKNQITAEYATSGHAAGTTVDYAGNRKGCGKCHSDQGFVETQYTGQDTLFKDIVGAQPIQCHTCHSFHNSLDFENEPNSALRTTAAVDLLMYRADGLPSVTIDLGPGSNLCANCHQPRRSAPDLAVDSFYVSSSHYGPHHGPHSTSLAGLGAAEVGTGYPAPGTGSKHATDADCVTCHMHGDDHSWEPSLDGCNTSECHNGSLTSVTNNSRQNTFRTLMGTLETKLQTAGLLDTDGHPVKGTYLSNQAAALYNYEWLVDDRSSGVHNFPYLETLLNNSIAQFP